MTGAKLAHLTLAEGEVAGHRHRITQGEAELYERRNGALYLKVLSHTALLSHEEHQPIAIPQGGWIVLLRRNMNPKDSAMLPTDLSPKAQQIIDRLAAIDYENPNICE